MDAAHKATYMVPNTPPVFGRFFACWIIAAQGIADRPVPMLPRKLCQGSHKRSNQFALRTA
jgi:hypothetical protein